LRTSVSTALLKGEQGLIGQSELVNNGNKLVAIQRPVAVGVGLAEMRAR
jgi:hypothetical protein